MLNTILSATSDYTYLLDKHLKFRFASEKGAAIHGLKQSDFDGKTAQELGMPAEYIESFLGSIRKAIATGQAETKEIFYPVVSGMRWFEYVVQPIVNEQGEVETVVVASQDITERKQEQDVLRQLAAIVETSGEAIFGQTLDGVITSWNSSAEDLFGYCAKEAIGQSFSLILSADHPRQEILDQIAAGKTVKDHDTTRVRKDGSFIEASVTISPIPDRTGKIVGASTVAHDITELKRMTRELLSQHDELLQERNRLVESNMALEEANRARGQFVATMSHELRTPLASIIGFSEMLLEDVIPAGWSPEQQSNLESILHNSEHLLELINDVLDLSKIETGRIVLNANTVDVRELLSSVAEEIQSLALSRHLYLRTRVEEGIDCLETNALKIRQILLNLVSNALKFTEQGGVTLSATRVSLQGQEAIAFVVQDTGIGIPSDIQAHIFEAFYQADMSFTRKVGGTGLGLAIVSQLTTLLGGTITVDSTPGQGSTFTVTLPIMAVHLLNEIQIPRLHEGHPLDVLAIPSSVREPLPALLSELLEVSGAHETAEGQRELILAVDDNEEAIVLIKAALQGMPYTVIGVQNPLTVMGLAQELRPAAITLDVLMMKLNGWQLLHQLKDNPATASIPVVILSVLSAETTGFVLGADDYMVKPFQKGVLCNKLQHVIAVSKRKPQQIERGN